MSTVLLNIKHLHKKTHTNLGLFAVLFRLTRRNEYQQNRHHLKQDFTSARCLAIYILVGLLSLSLKNYKK